MNILMIFRNNPLETSGAVTFDLFNDFGKRGHHVRLLVNKYDPRYPEGITSLETPYLYWKNKIANKLKRMLGKTSTRPTDEKYHFHEVDEEKMFYSTGTILKKAKMKPDAIVILFAKNFVNAKNLFELHQRTGAPVYWMMYDTSPLTGGCHYSWECLGYQSVCGKCPGLFSSDPHDLTYTNLAYKKKYLDKTNISIVLASEWQHDQASKSSLFRGKPIHKIFISIDPNVFTPIPKFGGRRKQGIGNEKKVIFFGAYFLHHERKGMRYLLDALRVLHDMLQDDPGLKNNVLLLVAGQEADSIKDQLPFETLSLGMLDNSVGIASAYQAADFFVCPSIEDAGPSMINQSVMCGTPVVSFAQGVSLDLVMTGKTGYQAKLKDSNDLANGMYQLLKLDEKGLQEMKTNCREMALELYHPEISVSRWLNMMEQDVKYKSLNPVIPKT